MEKVNTIMAAFDLEAGSEAVLTRAIQLARTHAARLVLLHVVEAEPLLQAAFASGRRENNLRRQVKRQALATIEPLLIESGRTRRTEVQVEFGSPHDIITHMAKERHADVILVGPGKGRTSRERFLGGTADRVIRTAHALSSSSGKGQRDLIDGSPSPLISRLSQRLPSRKPASWLAKQTYNWFMPPTSHCGSNRLCCMQAHHKSRYKNTILQELLRLATTFPHSGVPLWRQTRWPPVFSKATPGLPWFVFRKPTASIC